MCTFSDTELQLSSERLLVASHQHVSSLRLSFVKEAIGNGWWGSSFPSFHLSVRTRRGTPSACADDISWPCCFGQSLLKTLLGQILFSPNKCFLHLFKSPQQDRNRQNQTPPHDLSKLWEERVSRPWEKYKATGGPEDVKKLFPIMPPNYLFPCFCYFQHNQQYTAGPLLLRLRQQDQGAYSLFLIFSENAIQRGIPWNTAASSVFCLCSITALCHTDWGNHLQIHCNWQHGPAQQFDMPLQPSGAAVIKWLEERCCLENVQAYTVYYNSLLLSSV